MKTLQVDLEERSYPIYIGEKLIHQKDLICKHITGKQVLIVSNEIVAPLYLKSLMDLLTEYQVETLIMPDGEQYKNLHSFEQIISTLLEKRFSRNCTLIALGGGVIGDLTGYAAASYQRGAPFIQVPTTLLAQVDSSVGGKTAVNHSLGKNMIGAFYQPRAVIADTDTLKTLEERQLRAGMAEVIKYGLIRDEKFYQWQLVNMNAMLALQQQELIYAVARSCENKAAVVAEDETETGIRAILNLGHTFGHAIETAMEYKGWLHGEAIAAGMVMAARMSEKLDLLDAEDVKKVRQIVQMAKLPIRLPENIKAELMLDLMSVDKKAKDGIVSLILLSEIGRAVITDQYQKETLVETLREFEC